MAEGKSQAEEAVKKSAKMEQGIGVGNNRWWPRNSPKSWAGGRGRSELKKDLLFYLIG